MYSFDYNESPTKYAMLHKDQINDFDEADVFGDSFHSSPLCGLNKPTALPQRSISVPPRQKSIASEGKPSQRSQSSQERQRFGRGGFGRGGRHPYMQILYPEDVQEEHEVLEDCSDMSGRFGGRRHRFVRFAPACYRYVPDTQTIIFLEQKEQEIQKKEKEAKEKSLGEQSFSFCKTPDAAQGRKKIIALKKRLEYLVKNNGNKREIEQIKAMLRKLTHIHSQHGSTIKKGGGISTHSEYIHPENPNFTIVSLSQNIDLILRKINALSIETQKIRQSNEYLKKSGREKIANIQKRIFSLEQTLSKLQKAQSATLQTSNVDKENYVLAKKIDEISARIQAIKNLNAPEHKKQEKINQLIKAVEKLDKKFRQNLQKNETNKIAVMPKDYVSYKERVLLKKEKPLDVKTNENFSENFVDKGNEEQYTKENSDNFSPDENFDESGSQQQESEDELISPMSQLEAQEYLEQESKFQSRMTQAEESPFADMSNGLDISQEASERKKMRGFLESIIGEDNV